MKVDWGDVPEHVKKRKKSSIGLAAITAIALTGGILFVADRNGWVGYAKHLINPPLHSSTRIAPPSVPDAPSVMVEAVGEELKPQPSIDATLGVRQTTFNDSNYRPRQIINTMPPPPRQYLQSRNDNSAPRARGLTGSNRTTLRWEDNRQNRFWWEGLYRWSNGVLNYDDLCRSNSFPRKGSIEYRGCRQVAKQYLRNECRGGGSKNQELRRVYCHAENAFRH